MKIAKKHYVEWGIYEGRNRHCAQRITDQQAQCYLDKNLEDIKKDIKKKDKITWIEAKEHWYKSGWKEGRDYTCTGSWNGVKMEQPKQCAIDGQDCACEGTIYFTKLEASADKKNMPNAPATFSEALNYAFLQVDPIHGSLKCDSKLIGDMAPGFRKQCFCEKKMPRKPIFCA